MSKMRVLLYSISSIASLELKNYLSLSLKYTPLKALKSIFDRAILPVGSLTGSTSFSKNFIAASGSFKLYLYS